MSNVPPASSARRVDDVDATDLPAQQVDPDFAVPEDDEDAAETDPDGHIRPSGVPESG